MEPDFDTIGEWSEIKLEIIRKYAAAYSTILAAKGFYHLYIDAFAGPGVHLSKRSGEWVAGSPLNALEVSPPFREYHLIDADQDRRNQLRAIVGQRPDVFLYAGDCNVILPSEVFPRARHADYRRALCLLDPYNINLDWTVVAEAARMQSIEIL